jgi:bis(5'-nucleosyl)-tetraphosphatase (symmetrical)
MAIYAIGDVQGCFAELEKLLRVIQFDPAQDTLWFTGDLVNRGPRSLETLRYIKSLGNQQKVVLGNHDLHLLAVALETRPARRGDTFDEILHAPDRHELIDWLRHQSLCHVSEDGFVMVHAGLAPSWTIEKAHALSREVETMLQGDRCLELLNNMYGNEPDYWNDDLQGIPRLRCIINYMTRLRFCYADGRIDLAYKGDISNKPAKLIPWFQAPHRVNAKQKIIFGHWAALGGQTDMPNLYPLDTGCVWGNCLTAFRLEDEKRFNVKCI